VSMFIHSGFTIGKDIHERFCLSDKPEGSNLRLRRFLA